MNDLVSFSGNIGDSISTELSPFGSYLSTPRARYYYISDIHLDYKIANLDFGNGYPGFEGVDSEEVYIRRVADSIRDSYIKSEKQFSSQQRNSYILLNGDISADYRQLDIFFDAYTRPLYGEGSFGSIERFNIAYNTFFVAGNHELWSDDSTTLKMFKKLEGFLWKKYHIRMIQNQLVLISDSIIQREFQVLSRAEIMCKSVEEIQGIASKYREAILGGLGFSGYNPVHNAFTDGLYRGTVQTLEQDRRLTKSFEEIYKKLSVALADYPLICFTHMPKEDWSTDHYNPNWIYVSGHTHENHIHHDEEKTVFADNQIGYHDHNYTLKWFLKDSNTDCFRLYGDGKYHISMDDYNQFNWFRFIRSNMKRQDIDSIVMLKRSGIYMFFAKKRGCLYLLEGGSIRSIPNDLDYYYDNMVMYMEAISIGLEPIQELLKSISDRVKAIGGSGTIHGCIVDIDFYNHIYCNLYNGTITAYYATDIQNKTVYSNVAQLLKNQCPELYSNYLSLDTKTVEEVAETRGNDPGFYVGDTSMYTVSNIARKYQYALNDKVIRIWNDELLRKYKKELYLSDTMGVLAG